MTILSGKYKYIETKIVKATIQLPYNNTPIRNVFLSLLCNQNIYFICFIVHTGYP